MPDKAKQSGLPAGLAKQLEKQTEATTDDKINYLQDENSNLAESLKLEKNRVTELAAKVQVLEDNSTIKRAAVKYAKVSLFVIPIACLILFSLSSMDIMKISNYAQAALIVAPIAFFATIIGFLLKGVFGQNLNASSMSATDILKKVDKD